MLEPLYLKVLWEEVRNHIYEFATTARARDVDSGNISM